MRKRFVALGLSLVLGSTSTSAQQPRSPVGPGYPAPLPPVAPPSLFPPSRVPPQPLYPAPPVSPQLPSYPAMPNSPTPQQSSYPFAPQYPYPTQPPVSTRPGSYVPGQPNQLSGPLTPTMPVTPGMYLNSTQGRPTPNVIGTVTSSPAAEIPLPHEEQKVRLSAMDMRAMRALGGWQVWVGQKMFRDLGNNEMNARDIVRVFRDLRPTEWVTIGGARPVVEYGLTNGRPALAGAAPSGQTDANGTDNPNQGSYNGPVVTGAGAKFIQPIDLQTARLEPIRGVWCVRDDYNILFNFGTDKASGEQTIAVIRKYGFNRIGVVGSPAQPAMSYLFASLDTNGQKAMGAGQLFMNSQIDALNRTGIPIPGVGYTGEMLKIDSQKVETRKSGTEWVVASGTEILGHFGPSEWAAQEAARTIRSAGFTEFCKLGGTSNITFFLSNGKAPTRAPFSAQERSFDPVSLRVQQINGKWAVTERSRYLFAVSGPQEGETVVRVLKAYGFDQIAHMTAGGSKGGITFLVKSR